MNSISVQHQKCLVVRDILTLKHYDNNVAGAHFKRSAFTERILGNLFHIFTRLPVMFQ